MPEGDEGHSGQGKPPRSRGRGLDWGTPLVRRTLDLVQQLTGAVPGEKERTDQAEADRLERLQQSVRGRRPRRRPRRRDSQNE